VGTVSRKETKGQWMGGFEATTFAVWAFKDS
jgi:hypothetical protein